MWMAHPKRGCGKTCGECGKLRVINSYSCLRAAPAKRVGFCINGCVEGSFFGGYRVMSPLEKLCFPLEFREKVSIFSKSVLSRQVRFRVSRGKFVEFPQNLFCMKKCSRGTMDKKKFHTGGSVCRER